MPQAGVEDGLRADDVRDDEVLRTVNGTVDVGLCREVDDDVVAGEDVVKEVAVADVTANEGESRIALHRSEVVEVARIRELVVDRHPGDVRAIGPGQKLPNEMRPDETGRSGHEVLHWLLPFSRSSHSCAPAKSASVTPERSTGCLPSCRGYEPRKRTSRHTRCRPIRASDTRASAT